MILVIIKNSGKKSIPRQQPNQNKGMKIEDPVLLSLFMRLERYSILNTKCSGVVDSEGPEKNITTLRHAKYFQIKFTLKLIL